MLAHRGFLPAPLLSNGDLYSFRALPLPSLPFAFGASVEALSGQSRMLPLLCKSLCMQVPKVWFFPAVDCRPSKHASLWLIHFTCSVLSSYTSPHCYFGALRTVLSLALLENVLMKCCCLGLCLLGLSRAPWHEEFWHYGPSVPFSALSRGRSS